MISIWVVEMPGQSRRFRDCVSAEIYFTKMYNKFGNNIKLYRYEVDPEEIAEED